jgi:hypothetical protein
LSHKQHQKLSWHPAFLEAIQLELADFQDVLEFKAEQQLTSEPLRIDLLIIKKPKDLVIPKNIAHIFRTDNIFEYKSPEDYLSVRDFLKVYSYACLYAAITPDVDLADITLSFVTSRYPRELIKYLTGVRGYTVAETQPGIYVVTGDYLPVQIIQSKKLSVVENLWLKALTDDLESDVAGAILEAGSKRLMFSGAYMNVLIRANPEAFLEVQTMARKPTFEEVFTEAGLIPQWIERGIKQGLERGIEQGLERGIEQGIEQGKEEKALVIARNLLAKGWAVEDVAETTDLPIEKIRRMLFSK